MKPEHVCTPDSATPKKPSTTHLSHTRLIARNRSAPHITFTCVKYASTAFFHNAKHTQAKKSTTNLNCNNNVVVERRQKQQCCPPLLQPRPLATIALLAVCAPAQPEPLRPAPRHVRPTQRSAVQHLPQTLVLLRLHRLHGPAWTQQARAVAATRLCAAHPLWRSVPQSHASPAYVLGIVYVVSSSAYV